MSTVYITGARQLHADTAVGSCYYLQYLLLELEQQKPLVFQLTSHKKFNGKGLREAFPQHWASALSPHGLRCQGSLGTCHPAQGARAEPARHGRNRWSLRGWALSLRWRPTCVRCVAQHCGNQDMGMLPPPRRQGAPGGTPHQGATVAGNGMKPPVFLFTCTTFPNNQQAVKNINPYELVWIYAVK